MKQIIAQQKIHSVHPHIFIVEWDENTKNNSIYYNQKSKTCFISKFTNVIRRKYPGDSQLQKAMVLEGSKKLPLALVKFKASHTTTEDQARLKLRNAHSGEYEIALWGGTLKSVSTFIHMPSGLEFKSTLSNLLRSSKPQWKQQIYPWLFEFCNEHEQYPYLTNQRLLRHTPSLIPSSELSKEITFAHYKKVLFKSDSNMTSPELLVKSMLDNLNINFEYNKFLTGTQYKPDFIINTPAKLIVEVDGLYYHSEIFRNKSYHVDKYDAYTDAGYRLLAVTDIQVRTQTQLVKSMIKARLGLSQRVFARTCAIDNVLPGRAAEFFNTTHLKGSGSGQCFALVKDGHIKCALRVRNMPNHVEIDRFSNQLDTVVVGGYSKLIRHVFKLYKKPIVSFVDRRVGSGTSLLQAGFVHINTHVGFEWTDKINVYNRRKFLGNSGRDSGCVKIWDYGQMKFILKL